MLYQELPSLESTPLQGWGRWLAPVLIVAVALTVAVLMVLVGQPLIAIVALGLGAAVAGVAALRSSKPDSPHAPPVVIAIETALLEAFDERDSSLVAAENDHASLLCEILRSAAEGPIEDPHGTLPPKVR